MTNHPEINHATLAKHLNIKTRNIKELMALVGSKTIHELEKGFDTMPVNQKH